MDRRSFLGRSSGAVAAFAAMPLLTPLNTKQREKIKVMKQGSKRYLQGCYALMKRPRDVQFFLTQGDKVLRGPEVEEVFENDDPWSLRYACKKHTMTEEIWYDGILVALPGGETFKSKFPWNPHVKPGDFLNISWTLSV